MSRRIGEHYSIVHESCHFLHCGHLHEPEAYESSRVASQCLTLAAGAAFESRDSHNAYSIVTLDLERARRAVKFIRYNPRDGRFSYESDTTYSLTIVAARGCGVREVAAAIEASSDAASVWPNYLAALLLEIQSEVPITFGETIAFGSAELLAKLPVGDLQTKTSAFFAVGNLVRLFCDRISVPDILKRHGQAVEEYAAALRRLCESDAGLRDGLAARERNARVLAGVEGISPFAHTVELLVQLKKEEDWGSLREQAERHISSQDRSLSLAARQMLAFGLLKSSERAHHERAVVLYRDLVGETVATAQDGAGLATALAAVGEYAAAKEAILLGIERFPSNAEEFLGIGRTVVALTGDRDLRTKLQVLMARRSAS